MTDIKATLEASPLSRTQIAAIALTAMLGAVDGYDVLAMTFAAPGVSAQWGISKAALGLALSSGLVGMAFGSFFISPLADKYGRRKLIITTLALMAVGMLMAAFSQSVIELSIWRIITGLGIGALVPIIVPLAVEYANAKRRRLALGVMSIGYPLGGTLGGFAAAALMYYSSWHAVFLLGAALSAILLAGTYFWLPEPPAFLIAKRPPNALARLNDYLTRCGHPPLETLPRVSAEKSGRASYRTIFSKRYRRQTIIVSSANLLFLMTVYYVLSWMPQLITDLGYSPSFATLAASVAAFSGVLSSLTVGLIGNRIPLRTIAGICMLGLTIFTCIFGLGGFGPVLLLCLAVIVGIFLYGGVVAVYGVVVESFETSVRATGVGFAMGMGRVAGAITPALAGQLFLWGMDRMHVSILLSLCALASAALMFASRREGNGSNASALASARN